MSIRDTVRLWPLAGVALPAGVATWSGWVELGEMTGFGMVQPLPGITDWQINTAITLPIGVECYAVLAMGTWLSRRPASHRTRRFAKWSAVLSLALGALGQIVYHLLEVRGAQRAPDLVVGAVSVLPILVLGMAGMLLHLRRADQEIAGTTDRSAVGQPTAWSTPAPVVGHGYYPMHTVAPVPAAEATDWSPVPVAEPTEPTDREAGGRPVSEESTADRSTEATDRGDRPVAEPTEPTDRGDRPVAGVTDWEAAQPIEDRPTEATDRPVAEEAIEGQPTVRVVLSDEEVLDLIRQAADTLGRVPSPTWVRDNLPVGTGRARRLVPIVEEERRELMPALRVVNA